MIDKQYTIEEHFVPKCYLNNFTNKNNKICVYDKKYNYYTYKTSTQICYDDNIYETKYNEKLFLLRNHLEEYNNSLENVYSPLLKMINKNFIATNFHEISLSQKDYEILDQFTANLILRHPIIINYFSLDKCNDNKINNLVYKRFENRPYINKERIAIALQKIEYLDRRQTNSYATLLEKIVSGFNKTLLISKTNCFITSEVPFTINVNSVGDLTSIFIPLSPHCVILYQSFKKMNAKMIIDDKTVLLINSFFMKKGVLEPRFLYSSLKDDFEIIKNSKDLK